MNPSPLCRPVVSTAGGGASGGRTPSDARSASIRSSRNRSQSALDATADQAASARSFASPSRR